MTKGGIFAMGICLGALAVAIVFAIIFKFDPEGTVPFDKGYKQGQIDCLNGAVKKEN